MQIRFFYLSKEEKFRIENEICKELKEQYSHNIKDFNINDFNHGNIYATVTIEDGTQLYITAAINRIAETMTICDDFSF